MVGIRGDAVRAIQGTFLENYLEASGKILDGGDYFPPATPDRGNTTALVITSTPSSGGSTRARVLFQMLIAGARNPRTSQPQGAGRIGSLTVGG